jgi:hypothetical protein
MERIIMSNRRFLVLTSLLLLGAAPVFVSCNAITGAGDLRLTGDDEDDDSSPADSLVNAAGLSITAIDLYQGVKRPLMAGGAPVTGGATSIVAGREALIRVFVSTSPDYDGLPVTGRLYIGEDKTPIEETKVLVLAPDEADLNTTMNFTVPGEKIVPGMTYRVELKQQKGAPESKGGWRYPEKDDEALEVVSDGATMKVVLVPIQYGADGSNRLPDTTPEQIQLFKDAFYGFYPIPSIDVQVRSEPMVWDQAVGANGLGWGELLDAVTGLRSDDKPADDVYYFGIFNPADSEGAFCQVGCVAGLAGLAGPSDEYLRAAIGLGFSGLIATETAVHEIGHTFGREHSPCGGADGPDPNYPYPEGNTGVWGYDLVSKKLLKPEMGDIMSYCSPSWISDYTFMKLFERFKIVNKAAKVQYPAEVLDRTYARVRIHPDGELVWRDPVKLHRPPVGHETKSVTVLTPTGPELVTGQYYPNDHIKGGVLLLPLPAAQTFTLKVDYEGQARTLTRQ